jgi:2-phosphosulfolactate phosphatase
MWTSIAEWEKSMSIDKVRLYSLLSGAHQATGTAIIIDVYRAYTTAAVAFQRGAEKIILTASVDEALDLRARGVGDYCMGEQDSIMPPEFDFGNSPYALSQADVRGKTLIQSTSAGTKGANAARNADRIYVAALVNAGATASAVRADEPERISIVAMGSAGVLRTDEDEQCALYLRNLILGHRPDPEAVRSLVASAVVSAKFDDPARPQFDPRDREIALRVDSAPFAIRVMHEGGLMVARPCPLNRSETFI